MSQLKAQVDKLLTDVSSAYIPDGFICEQVLPLVQSKQYSGLLGKYGTAHLRIENALKGGRGKYRRVEAITRSTTNYVIQGHGLEGFVSKEDYANVEDPFDAESDEVLGVSNMLFLEKEKLLADTLSSTATMTQNTTLSGATQWTDYNNSDPVGVVTDGKNTILNAVGVEPNLGIIDLYGWNKLRFHPQFLVALGYRYMRPGGLKEEEVASALGLDKVLIAKVRYESAKENQTSALLPVWGKHFILAVAPAKAQKRQVSLGYMLRPTGSSPRKVYKQVNFNPPGSTALLVEDEYDMLISNANAGYLIRNAFA